MEKINSIIEIAELIARDISGQLNDLEHETLEKWINYSEHNEQLYQQIKDCDNLALRNLIYDNVNIPGGWTNLTEKLAEKPLRRMLPQFFKYAAAILLPVLLGVSTYWLLNEKSPQTVQPIAEIVPGTRNAVLVLASGKSVNLSNGSTQKLIEKDGSLIQNYKKELNYTQNIAQNPKKSIYNTLIVPQGGEYTLVLSDGTRVFVNSMSKLVFPVAFVSNKREITLEGEACFEVAQDKSKPFIVTIKGMQIEVLGTTFNVKAYPTDDQSFTTLVEGKIKLNSGTSASDIRILEPDQQAIYNPTTAAMVIQKVDANQFMQWTKGKYVFTNQPLDEIMNTLSRWYDFKYQFEDASIRKIKFEGGLNKYENLDPILEIIKKTGKVNVTVKGKEVLFSRK